MINPCAPLLPPEVIERAKKLNVPLLLDGVKAAKLPIKNDGCMCAAINAVDRGIPFLLEEAGAGEHMIEEGRILHLGRR